MRAPQLPENGRKVWQTSVDHADDGLHTSDKNNDCILFRDIISHVNCRKDDTCDRPNADTGEQ